MTLQTHKLYIACDHAAIEMKDFLIEALTNDLLTKDLPLQDFGAFAGESVDYPDKAKEVAAAIKNDAGAFGVLICGTGIGISIAANRHDWVRAALVHTSYEAEITRKHNDANVIAFGARTLGVENAWHALKFFLTTEFEGGRHKRRVDKLIGCSYD